MEIVFLCGSVSLGRSGVGDYARKLAEELIRQGNDASLVGLAEPVNYEESQAAHNLSSLNDNVPLDTFQLSAHSPWKTRLAKLQSFLGRKKPDYISLQYVPYAFSSRGLPWRLAEQLRKATPTNARWQIMFHEIGLGLDQSASLKHRIIGKLQTQIASSLVHKLKPIAVHSHAAPYLDVLCQLGAKAKTLPLFSNVSLNSISGTHTVVRDISDKSTFINFAYFGTVHPDWSISQVAAWLFQIANSAQRRPRVIAVGQGGSRAKENWNAFRQLGIDVVETGMIDEPSVSSYISSCDYGLSGYPPDLIQKSSAASTLFAHGLQVLAPRPPLWGERYLREVQDACPLMVTGESKIGIRNAPTDHMLLPSVARKFVEDITVKDELVNNQ